MKRFAVASSILFVLLSVSCSGRKSAEKTAKRFVQAYYVDLDFAEAKTLVLPSSLSVVAEKEELTALNPYAKEDVPAIKFNSLTLNKNNPDKGRFSFMANRTEKTHDIRKTEDGWKVDLSSEKRPEEQLIELSSNPNSGFTSATSGPVVYKKRERKQ